MQDKSQATIETEPGTNALKLEESQELLRQLTENIQEVFFVVDHKDYRILYVSPSYEEIWGRTCESLLKNPTSWVEAIFPEDRERVLFAFENQFRTGEFDEEYRIVRPDKSLRWIHDRTFPIRNAKGETYRHVGIALDITARKQAEVALQEAYGELEQRIQERTQELSESEKRFRTMIERAPDGMLLLRQDGTIILVNKFTEEKFGYDQREMVDQSLKKFLPGHRHDAFEQHLKDFFSGPRRVFYDSSKGLMALAKDGREFPVEVALSPLETTEGVVVCLTFRDITHRKEAEKKLEKTQKELTRLSRHLIQSQETERRRLALELHDQLGQNLALLSVEIEQLRQKDPESQAQLGEQLQGLGKRTQELISKVQTLSHRLHPSKLAHLGLVAASRSLCMEVSKSTDIQIDFSDLDVARSIPQEVSTCLFRVLQESLTNVVKHSGAKTAQVKLAGSPNEIQLQVLDSGVGFDPESTGSRGGLGLISMRERISLLGGELLIESRPSGNTWIKACLPLNSSVSPD